MKKVSWGVLSTAKIGVEKVIPALQRGTYCQVTALASQDLAKARAAGKRLGIPKAYGSYEELLADRDIEAVYIPLPNNLHVEWAVKALEAGKHVLCEKPIGMNVAEAQKLLAASRRHPHLKIMEAFMYRMHPQWVKAKELVAGGRIGELKTIQSFFSYNNRDPANIRNRPETGGGGLMDIGCYCISLARFLFDAEPRQVLGVMDYDPAFGTDRLTSGVLDFGNGTSTFTCSTQLTPYQRVNIFGTEGRLEIEIPFNAPPDVPCRMWHQTKSGIEEITFPVCNQHTIQGDLFAQAILNNTDVPTPLTDAVANMKVIEAVIGSTQFGRWWNMNVPIRTASRVAIAEVFRDRRTRPSASTRPHVSVLTLRPSRLDSGQACSLLLSAAELQEGDAAALYREAGVTLPDGTSERIWDNVRVPLGEFAVEKVQAFLKSAGPTLQSVERAAHCRTCTWPAFDPENPPADELTRLRLLMFPICLQARLDIKKGRYDAALGVMRTAVAMARHVGDASVAMLTCLGIALARMAMERVEDMAQAPDSPNLYTALAALPTPLVEGKMRASDKGYRLESRFMHRLEAYQASLQCIEALRDYAATHSNKLPTGLGAITDVKLPCDPATGQPFTYCLEDTKAILEVSPPKGCAPGEGLRYEITVAP